MLSLSQAVSLIFTIVLTYNAICSSIARAIFRICLASSVHLLSDAGEPVAAMGDMIYLGGGCQCLFAEIVTSPPMAAVAEQRQRLPGSTLPVRHQKSQSKKSRGSGGMVTVNGCVMLCHFQHAHYNHFLLSIPERKPPRRQGLQCRTL